MDLPADLAASVAASSIAITLCDARAADHPIAAVNAAFTDLTGYKDDAVLGRNARLLQGPQTDPAERARVRAALAAGRTVLAELVNYRADGSPFRNAMTIAPVLDDNGGLAFFLGHQVEIGGGSDPAWSARRRRAEALVAALSPRQAAVLRALAEGLPAKLIAHRLDLAERTVEMHHARLLAALRVRNTVQAIRIGVEAGL